MQKLSESELAIMQKLWQTEESVTVSQLVEAFSGSRGWKTQTVNTFLTRLAEKGFVHSEKRGVQNLYTVAIPEAEYRSEETRSFLRGVHGGSVQSFLTALYDGDGLPESEIDELKKWLAGR